MSSIEDEDAVLQHIVQYLSAALLPRVVIFIFRQNPVKVVVENPIYQIINILKMVIEGLTVDAAVLYNILNGDLAQGFFFQKISQMTQIFSWGILCCKVLEKRRSLGNLREFFREY